MRVYVYIKYLGALAAGDMKITRVACAGMQHASSNKRLERCRAITADDCRDNTPTAADKDPPENFDVSPRICPEIQREGPEPGARTGRYRCPRKALRNHLMRHGEIRASIWVAEEGRGGGWRRRWRMDGRERKKNVRLEEKD